MLNIVIPSVELWDEKNEQFIHTKERKLQLEHSLVSVAKWEANTNIQNGVPIAIILQYGHGTRNGGWVQGRDYINPAIQPIFDEIVKSAWKEVTSL